MSKKTFYLMLKTHRYAIGAVVGLVAALGAFAWWISVPTSKVQPKPRTIPVVEKEPVGSAAVVEADEPLDEPATSSVADEEQGEDWVTAEAVTVSRARELNVKWIPVADRVWREETLVAPLGEEFLSRWKKRLDILCRPAGYQVMGEVSGGAYDGYTVSFDSIECGEMGAVITSFFVLTSDEPDARPIVLDRGAVVTGWLSANDVKSVLAWLESDQSFSSDVHRSLLWYLGDLIEVEMSAVVPVETFPDALTDRAGRTLHLVRNSYFGDAVSGLENPPVDFVAGAVRLRLNSSVDGRASFYGAGMGYHYAFDERGVVYYYSVQAPFLDGDGELVGVTKLNGEPLSGRYNQGRYGGCGVSDPIEVADEEQVGDLVEVAKYRTADGSGSLYAASPYGPGAAALQEYYKMWDVSTRGWEASQKDDDTWQEFLESYPVLYYHDAFDRLLVVKNVNIRPMAECAKPVIYLYPEEPTDVTVTVAPQGGLTFTEPAYRDGWRVTAYPDGRLVNKDDGLSYPYLFWEGRGGDYAPPNRYWVVSRRGVEEFLVATLHEFGLNDQETADFVEYWHPFMQDAPYYRIGFHGTSVMNEIAPLGLTVEPDSLLRVFMDFAPLSEPEPSNPPSIPAFERQGFTLVEWGGVGQN